MLCEKWIRTSTYTSLWGTSIAKGECFQYILIQLLIFITFQLIKQQVLFKLYCYFQDRDRFFIFSVLLEHKRTPAIIRLADAWLDGSHANVGCTVDLIITWIGHYMVALRELADEHWHNLLSFADYALPPETVRFINFSNFAWTSLEKLLLALLGPSEVYSGMCFNRNPTINQNQKI